jgi:hypothetical protein
LAVGYSYSFHRRGRFSLGVTALFRTTSNLVNAPRALMTSTLGREVETMSGLSSPAAQRSAWRPKYSSSRCAMELRSPVPGRTHRRRPGAVPRAIFQQIASNAAWAVSRTSKRMPRAEVRYTAAGGGVRSRCTRRCTPGRRSLSRGGERPGRSSRPSAQSRVWGHITACKIRRLALELAATTRLPRKIEIYKYLDRLASPTGIEPVT